MKSEKYTYIKPFRVDFFNGLRYYYEARNYLGRLGLKWEDLAGKKVLDRGAGTALLALGAKKRGLDITFMEAFPEDTEETYREGNLMGRNYVARRTWRQFPPPLDQKEYIVANMFDPIFAQEHKDNYDLIVCHAANIGTTADAKLQGYKNINTMLKVGGEVRIWPTDINPDYLQNVFPNFQIEVKLIDKKFLYHKNIGKTFYKLVKLS